MLVKIAKILQKKSAVFFFRFVLSPPPACINGTRKGEIGQRYEKDGAIHQGFTYSTKPTTQVKHPWTNGQVERMNRTLKEATVKRFKYQTGKQLKGHLMDYLMAYNFAKRLKALKGKTPWEFIREKWKIDRKLFHVNPDQFIVGLNI